MRTSMFVLLLIAVPAHAEDSLEAALAAVADARENTYMPGARARVNPALEGLRKYKDPAVVEALASYIVFTLEKERPLVDAIKEAQRSASGAKERKDAIDAELKHLEIRRRAGAQDLGPRLEELGAERRTVDAAFIEARDETHRLERARNYGREVREQLVVECGRAARALAASQVEAGLLSLRRTFDLKHPLQALLLVRVLRDSGLKEAAPHLIEILHDPNVKRPAALQAVLALAALKDPAGTEELARMWEKDTAGLKDDIQYALSMAAKKQLSDPAAARAWAKSLAK
jgi:hypothetical protein